MDTNAPGRPPTSPAADHPPAGPLRPRPTGVIHKTSRGDELEVRGFLLRRVICETSGEGELFARHAPKGLQVSCSVTPTEAKLQALRARPRHASWRLGIMAHNVDWVAVRSRARYAEALARSGNIYDVGEDNEIEDPVEAAVRGEPLEFVAHSTSADQAWGEDGAPLPILIRGGEMGGLHDEHYDLEQALEVLLARPDVQVTSKVDLRSADALRRRRDSWSESGIIAIPHYNATAARGRTIHFAWSPTEADMAVLEGHPGDGTLASRALQADLLGLDVALTPAGRAWVQGLRQR